MINLYKVKFNWDDFNESHTEYALILGKDYTDAISKLVDSYSKTIIENIYIEEVCLNSGEIIYLPASKDIREAIYDINSY